MKITIRNIECEARASESYNYLGGVEIVHAGMVIGRGADLDEARKDAEVALHRANARPAQNSEGDNE